MTVRLLRYVPICVGILTSFGLTHLAIRHIEWILSFGIALETIAYATITAATAIALAAMYATRWAMKRFFAVES